jgi:purine-nucleoside phosphorylase
MSIHLEAAPGEIAPTVLLPGDPLRAKFIAETFLENVHCHNKVRGMLGYTGTYNGKPVSVQGTGMGVPSHSIYVNELIRDYQAKQLIRIGTCGSLQEGINVKEVVIAMAACTDSSMNKLLFGGMDYSPIADYGLLKKAMAFAEKNNIATKVGNVLTSDIFYFDDDLKNPYYVWMKYGVLAVEMETAALYTLAARLNVKALSILTVSDNIVTGQHATAEERQTAFTDMVKIALELAE